MHGDIVKVVLEAIVGAHLLYECHLLEERLLIDDKDHILVWKRLVVESGSNVVGEGVNTRVGSRFIPRV